MLRHKMEEAGCDQLTFTLQRPEQRQVILPKSDRLGIDISFRKGVSVRQGRGFSFMLQFCLVTCLDAILVRLLDVLSARPWITGVRGGAMGQWNLEKPRFNVHAHDRILSVSGVSGIGRLCCGDPRYSPDGAYEQVLFALPANTFGTLTWSGGPLEIVDKLRRSEDSLMITFLHYADDVQS